MEERSGRYVNGVFCTYRRLSVGGTGGRPVSWVFEQSKNVIHDERVRRCVMPVLEQSSQSRVAGSSGRHVNRVCEQ